VDIILKFFSAGLNTLVDYLSFHVISCLIPAFFIAGAIRIFIPTTMITRYFGPTANKWIAYSLASISGSVLAVCSCTVIPMFAGMYMSGAGIGPSTTLLYSGPAINILAIVYSARLLGLDLGIGRAISAILFSVVIGLLMAVIFKRKVQENLYNDISVEIDSPEMKPYKIMIFFSLLIIILVFGAAKDWIITVISIGALLVVVYKWFSWEDVKDWLVATFGFVKLILPWLLIGVFAAGIIKELLPQRIVSIYVGSNSLFSNFIASIIGSLMYFSTLTEVPIVRALLDLQMSRGPALALLLAAPALSLPSMLAIGKVMGRRKTIIYIILLVIMSILSGLIFGELF
jgi:uncharacterized membrane protein YraQ (UPF0718 family)